MSKKLIVAAIALTAGLGAGLAQAHGRDDVQWSVTIGTPVYGAPVYNTAPVYVEPAPVYAPAYGSYGYSHHYYRQPTRWDRDGDGIPNRYDPVYNPRWDRNGDGIPDRYERYDHRYERGHYWGR